MTHLKPQAVGVVIRCRHLCMESCGIRTRGEETVTSSMLGELHSNQALRAEFFALAREAYFNFWNEHLKHRPSNSDRTPADPKGAAIPLSEAHLHLKGGIDTPVPRY